MNDETTKDKGMEGENEDGEMEGEGSVPAAIKREADYNQFRESVLFELLMKEPINPGDRGKVQTDIKREFKSMDDGYRYSQSNVLRRVWENNGIEAGDIPDESAPDYFIYDRMMRRKGEEHSILSLSSVQRNIAEGQAEYAFINNGEYWIRERDKKPISKAALHNLLDLELSFGRGEKHTYSREKEVCGRGTHRIYEDSRMMPGVQGHVGDVFNRWKGWGFDQGVEVPPEVREEVLSLRKRLVLNLCNGDEVLAVWLDRIMAFRVQNPGVLGTHVIAMCSEQQGSGKSLYGEVHGVMWGPHYKLVTDQNLKSDFNGWAEDALLVHVEEPQQGDKRDARTFTAALKVFSTQDVLFINRKFIGQYEVKNLALVLVTTNNRFPFADMREDRRIFLLAPEDKLDQEVGDKLGWYKREHPDWLGKVLHGFYREVDLAGYKPNEPVYRTEYLLESIDMDTLFGEEIVEEFLEKHGNDKVIIFRELTRYFIDDRMHEVPNHKVLAAILHKKGYAPARAGTDMKKQERVWYHKKRLGRKVEPRLLTRLLKDRYKKQVWQPGAVGAKGELTLVKAAGDEDVNV